MDDRRSAASDVSFGAWVQERRKVLDLTQGELANQVGCSLSTVRKIERDERRPSQQIAALLAVRLGLPPEQQELFQRVARGQLRVDRLPPPALTGAADEPRAQVRLPIPPTPLVGREAELAALADLLADAQCRLLSLVGPGGIGKTRLAIEAAGRQQHAFADGVYFVALAAISSAAFMVPAIASAVGLPDRDLAEPRLGLLRCLQRKQMLIVLDNLEHLPEGVPLIAEMLAGAPGLRVLATSRERLNLQGEWVFEVQGLPVPPSGQLEGLAGYSASALFIQRAQRARATFALTAEESPAMVRICQMVGGMPLGIELAAAWVSMLSCREIAAEIERSLDFLTTAMRDVPARQRSLRAVFDHSWNMLAADERQALRRLSIFQATFSREAAEQVAGANLSALLALASKSLIRRSASGRYDLHHVVRQFAREHLEKSGELDQLRAAHSAYFLRTLGQLEQDLKGRRQAAALDQVAEDIEEIRAAWRWAVRHDDWATLDLALESLYLFCDMRGRTPRGEELLELADRRLAHDETGRLRGRILGRLSLLRNRLPSAGPEIEADIRLAAAIARQHDDLLEIGIAHLADGFYRLLVSGDVEAARPLFEQSLDAFRAVDEPYYVARALHRVGYCTDSSQQPGVYAEYTRQSLEVAEASGNKYDMAWALHNLAGSALFSGEYVQAEAYVCRAIDLASETKDEIELAISQAMLGLGRFLQGELEEARTLAATGLALATDLDHAISMAYAYAVLGLVAAVSGDASMALQLSRQSQALPSNDPGAWLGRWPAAIAYCDLGDLAAARRELHFMLEMALRDHWRAFLTWQLPIAAVVLANQDEETQAAELLALATMHPLSQAGWIDRWRLVAELPHQLQTRLGPDDYRMARDRGRARDLEATTAALLRQLASG